jgi:hypothetical protein
MKPTQPKPQYIVTANIPEPVALKIDDRAASLGMTRSGYVAWLIKSDIETDSLSRGVSAHD